MACGILDVYHEKLHDSEVKSSSETPEYFCIHLDSTMWCVQHVFCQAVHEGFCFVFYSDSSFKLKPSAVIDRSFCFRRNHDSQTVKNDMEDAVGIRWVDYKGKHQRDWMTWMKWSPNFPPGHSDSCILSGEFFSPPVR